jgi:acyl carrier protein
VLRTAPERVPIDSPFSALGLDSLMGLELRNRLERSLGTGLPATMVWSHPTIAALVPHLADRLGVTLEAAPGDTPPAPPSADSPAHATLDDVSDDEASRLLAAKLADLESEYLS